MLQPMMGHQRFTKWLIVTSLFAFISTGVAGADPYKKLLKESCGADIAKHCKGSALGVSRGDAAWNCLEEKKTELSHDCSVGMVELESSLKTLKTSCESDLDRFCSAVAPGGGAWVDCLSNHEKDLNSFCRDGLKKKFDL